MASLNTDITVPFTGPDCPACHDSIVMQATVRIKTADIRKGGSTFHHTDMIADLTTEVVEIAADHGCKPSKEDL